MQIVRKRRVMIWKLIIATSWKKKKMLYKSVSARTKMRDCAKESNASALSTRGCYRKV